MSEKNSLVTTGFGALLRGGLHPIGKFIGETLTGLNNTKQGEKSCTDIQKRLVELGYAKWITVDNAPQLKYLNPKIEYIFTGEKSLLKSEEKEE